MAVGQPLGADNFFSRLSEHEFFCFTGVTSTAFRRPDDSAAQTFRNRRGRFVLPLSFTASFHLDVVAEAKVGPVVGPRWGQSVGACADGGEWIVFPLAAPTIGASAGRPQVVWRPATLAPRLQGGISASSGLRSNGGRRNGGHRKIGGLRSAVAQRLVACAVGTNSRHTPPPRATRMGACCSAPCCLRRAPIAELLAPRVVLTRPAMPMQASNCGGAA